VRAPLVAAHQYPVPSGLAARVHDVVAAAGAALREHLAANPNRLHELCVRGATAEEYAAEARRVRAAVAAVAGGPVGEVVLPAPDPGCRRSRDEWLSAGIANVLCGSALTDGRAFEGMQGDVADADVQRALGEIVAGSADENERLAALILLERAAVEPIPFPREAYSSLGQKTPTEIQLTLSAHATVPVPPDSLGDVRAIALDEGQPEHVRRSALTALGHGASAPSDARMRVE
jgi:hypothetical protein